MPGDPAQKVLTSTRQFNTRHRPTSVTDPLGHVTTYSYEAAEPPTGQNASGRLQSVTDAQGFVTTHAAYDVYGTARTVTDPNGGVTTLGTDARGRVTTRTLAPNAGDPVPASYTTTSHFDGRDRMDLVTTPNGNQTSYVYEDGTNRLLATIRLDGSGNQREQLLFTLNDIGGKTGEQAQSCGTPAPICAPAAWTTERSEQSSYDTKNRLMRTTHPSDGTYIAYTYDAAGRLASVQDERHPTGPNTTYVYDALGRLVSVTQKLGASNAVTAYGYDAHDNLTSVTDPNRNVTSYAFDDFRQLRTQASPVSGTTTHGYDDAGNLTSTTDGNGATTTRTYDALGRLSSAVSAKTGAVTETVTHTYDDLSPGNYGRGRLKTSSVSEGGTTNVSSTYTYDRRGLLLSEASTLFGSSFTTSYGYDPDGNRTRVTYPSGRIVDTTYDFAGRPFSQASTTPSAVTYVSSATYAPFGPEKVLTLGNGTTRTATWSLRYLPSTLTLTGGSVGSAVSYSYTADGAGNPTVITDVGDSAYSWSFGYDDLSRLTSASKPGASPTWGPAAFQYDALGNRTAMTVGSRSVTYAYDVVSTKTTSRLASTTEGGATTPLLRDPAGNETAFGPASSRYSTRNLLLAAGLSAFRYDARGVRVAEEVASGSGLYPITPCRVLDTRNPAGPHGGPAIPAGGSRSFTFQGQCGLPPGARAVALNITVPGPSAAGSFALFPSDIPLPASSSISFATGRTRANNGILTLSLAGELSIFNSTAFATDAIVDATAYFKELSTSRRLFFYTPELNLLTETSLTSGTPAVQTEYVWFGGRPVAQETVNAPRQRRYTMTDHLGTPIVQTNNTGTITWRAEYEPFGTVYSYRAGAATDQVLRLPGQEERTTTPGRYYNVFRWYRPDLGQYTQPDPISLEPQVLGQSAGGSSWREDVLAAASAGSGMVDISEAESGEEPMGTPVIDLNVFRYGLGRPTHLTDPTGLAPLGECLGRCMADHFGLNLLLGGGGATALAAGLPVIPKRFSPPGATKGTSVASSYLRKKFCRRLATPGFWAPTLRNPLSRTTVVGGVFARWLPWIGAGLLTYDAISIGVCANECRQSSCACYF